MGLDMYLYKKTYVQNWKHTPKEQKYSISIKRGGKKVTTIQPNRISEITESVGYWRKFNALHNYFVQNFADGVDDCKEMYVPKEDLEKLLDVLRKVKKILDKSKKKKSNIVVGWANGEEMREDVEVYDSDKIEELLPTAPGFFFGGTEYDDYYYDQVTHTIGLFEALLEEDDISDFYYEASW